MSQVEFEVSVGQPRRWLTARPARAASARCREPRAEVWRALAVLEPYCAVCDVSYVVGRRTPAPGVGTTFVCAPGRLDGGPPPAGAPQGEIVDWEPRRLVTTRLVLTPETWTTRIELADTGGRRHPGDDDHHPRADRGRPGRPAAPARGAAPAGAADRGRGAGQGAGARRPRADR